MQSLVKQLVDPVALVWCLMWLALGVLLWKKRFWPAAWVGLGIVLVCVFAGSDLPRVLVVSIEKTYHDQPGKSVTESDAVLVLGGYLGNGDYDLTGMDVGESFDRLLTGIELIRGGKAPLLIVGGGAAGTTPNAPLESEAVQAWNDRWQLVDTPIEGLGRARNTYEEAQITLGLAKERDWQRVILVTSALHMRRAHAVFETVFESSGVEILPVACDFANRGRGGFRFPIPSSGRVRELRNYIYEVVGYYGYRLRGWIRD